MVIDDEETTAQVSGVPVVLVVGCPPHVVDLCRDVSPLGALVKECDFASAPTLAAALRPHVLVVTEDLYAFDPEEFDALARDVRATVARIPRVYPYPEMIGWVVQTAYDEARRRRR